MTTPLESSIKDVAGNAKQALGTATGDTSLKTEGVVDQLTAKAEKGLNAIGVNNDVVGKTKAFAKERPWAFAAAAGVIGLALLNTLRGKKA